MTYVQSPFTVAGWAIDYAAASTTGVSTLHVWAYPASGAPAQFVGVVSYGGARPDIKALFGDNFEYSGYGLTAELAPGAYTLAVFPWSTAAGGFTAAMTMDIVVQSGPFASTEQVPAGGPSPDGSTAVFIEDGRAVVPADWTVSPVLPTTNETLTVDLAGTGTGTVTSSPSGLAMCTGTAQTCSGTFASGTVVTLSAAAASGHEFLGWSGACAGTSTCTVTMSAARYVAAQFRLATPPVVTRYYHLDALGSVRAVTKQDGATARLDDYHAFGEAGTPPQGDSIRFTGKERDAETALDYFGARYYRNLMGRFTTVDPHHVGGNVFDPQSWNAYAYARNNPLRFIDPTGTDYYVKPKGGTDFLFPGTWDSFEDFASPFSLVGDEFHGDIFDSSGQKVGTYTYVPGMDRFQEAGQRAKPIEALVGGLMRIAGLIRAPVLAALAECGIAGAKCSAGETGLAVIPGGPFWKSLKPWRGKVKTDGKKLFKWDYTHRDIEVFDSRGKHLGSANPNTGAMTKPPVPGRKIDK